MTSQNSVQPSCSQGLDNLQHVDPVLVPNITPGGGVTISCPPDRQAQDDQTHQQGLGASGVCSVTSVVSDSLRPHGLWPTRLLCPWDSPVKNTGMGCHALLQGDLPNPARDRTHFACIGRRVGSLPLVPPGSSWKLRVKGSESALKGRNGSQA